jgi:hypothetical protein
MELFRALAGWSLLVVAMLTVGCATTPQSTTPSTVLSAPAEGRARIVFYRPSGVFGYAMRADIFLDGKRVGKSAPGTKFYVDTTPGIHRVTVPTILYSGESTLDVSVAEGQVIYVRTSIGGSAIGGRTNIELVGPPQGTEDTANLDLVASE